MLTVRFAAVIPALAVVCSSAVAALVRSGDGLTVTDTEAGLMWLTDADPFGPTTFTEALAHLDQRNGASFLGYSDWRLPRTLVPDPTCSSPDHTNGYGCSGSELGNFFYNVFGGIRERSITEVNNGLPGLFANLRATYYWSETPSPVHPGPYTFNFGQGSQDASNDIRSPYRVWFVRDARSGLLPEASSLHLMVLALLAMCTMPPLRKRFACAAGRLPGRGRQSPSQIHLTQAVELGRLRHGLWTNARSRSAGRGRAGRSPSPLAPWDPPATNRSRIG